MNYVYIVKCKDETLYTGWTNDLNKRIISHNNGTGAKYTRSRNPVVLKYSECFENKKDAQKREYEIKQLSREEKLCIINKASTDTNIELLI